MAKPGFFEYVADRLVSGAESELAARLTSEALRMLAEGVAEPDRYAVLARLCPQALSAVLAEAGPSVEREAWGAPAPAPAARGGGRAPPLGGGGARGAPPQDARGPARGGRWGPGGPAWPPRSRPGPRPGSSR